MVPPIPLEVFVTYVFVTTFVGTLLILVGLLAPAVYVLLVVVVLVVPPFLLFVTVVLVVGLVDFRVFAMFIFYQMKYLNPH
jgi:hypothetical protein